jgi:hypothetical protein
MEENLCKIEIFADGNGYKAKIFTETEGTKEMMRPSLESLLRDLSVDLEFMFESLNREEESGEL